MFCIYCWITNRKKWGKQKIQKPIRSLQWSIFYALYAFLWLFNVKVGHTYVFIYMFTRIKSIMPRTKFISMYKLCAVLYCGDDKVFRHVALLRQNTKYKIQKRKQFSYFIDTVFFFFLIKNFVNKDRSLKNEKLCSC